jgi:hypothetical protein
MDVVVFGDSHLRDAIWVNKPMKDDSYISFDQIIDYVCGVKDCKVIILGDILDSKKPTSKPAIKLKQGLDRLIEHCGKIAIIQGQHDVSDPPWFSLVEQPDKVIHLSTKIFDYDGLKVCGIDNMTRPALLKTLEAVDPSADFLALHNLLKSGPASQFGDIELSELPDIPIIGMGDLHDKVMKKDSPNGRDRVVFHPGSGCIQKINENPVKQFMHIVIEDSSYTFNWKPLSTRRIVRKRLHSEEEADRFLDNLSLGTDHVSLKTLVYVEFNSSIPDIHRKVESKCKELDYIFWPSPYLEMDMPETEFLLEDLTDAKEVAKAYFESGSKEYAYLLEVIETSDIRNLLATRRPELIRCHLGKG